MITRHLWVYLLSYYFYTSCSACCPYIRGSIGASNLASITFLFAATWLTTRTVFCLVFPFNFLRSLVDEETEMDWSIQQVMAADGGSSCCPITEGLGVSVL